MWHLLNKLLIQVDVPLKSLNFLKNFCTSAFSYGFADGAYLALFCVLYWHCVINSYLLASPIVLVVVLW